MRKALVGLIMAATVLTPIAAEAQERGRDRGEERSERVERSRAERQAQREARPQQQAQQPQQQQAEQPQPQRAERAQQRNQGQQGEAQRSDVARERSRGAWGDQQRSERAQQTQAIRGQRQQAYQQRQQSEQQSAYQGDGRRDGSSQRNSAYPDAWQGNPNDPARRRYEQLERRNQYRYGTDEQRRDVRQEGRDWRGDRDGRGDYRRDRNWSRDWNRTSWRNDRRYDWQNWRYRNRSLFRLSPYYSPYRNYRYRRFSIGLFLEPLLFSQNYWIGNPYQYRLPYAPPGTQWVRYYNDVLLVDVYSGEVVDVIYDFFW